ncbi:hypothetical protein PHYSODRAFT_524117 [Phytophthora sojae]|uniref:WLGC domain-containing protein n=1 Tax=Phytophthora sojae (strain P6497) TaxID=1094619 RepID=G5A5M1_PHYSP|nr:hypothetical protein PHYSODRAFT_524117 [Phytophthora sojae]EGZ08626.1 hypothetical protein PHYSODRAFT_524117 [Phytophthora sojae]|eukprot:XP_009535259.1 hypothetical protein PHYSODRAFT_524117 [Phytophthora sojae]
MNTGDYDNGQFWLIIDANSALTMAGVVGLVIVSLSYLFVVLKMLLWREKILTPAMLRRLERRLLGSWNGDGSRLESRTWSIIVGPTYRRAHSVWRDLTSFNGRNRKLWNAGTKVVDLVMQMLVLLQLLRSGSPVALVYGYALFVAANSLSSAINILFDRFSALTEVLIDSLFDFSAAVLFRITTLVYCYYNFEFDRTEYLTYLKMLKPGSFEHIARLFGDQSEIALFRVSFDSLRFSSVLDLVTQISMNLAFCYRIKRMMENTLPVPKVIAAAFFLYSVATVVITHQSVSQSIAACSAYPDCVVYAYRWTSSDGPCPCLIFIDVNKSPKTFDEWIHPPQAYTALEAVSKFGTLESIQIINRQLLEFPEELRSCSKLKSIQLMYTSVEIMPAWAAEFSHLETFHIEGKLGSINLQELPEKLFTNMPNLAMVHLGVHGLRTLPPLTGVPNLQSLTLAWMFAFDHLPPFDHVPNLRRLVISVVPFLQWVPDMSPLRDLIEFAILPGVICCNGFLGACDLTDYLCAGNPQLGLPSATCLMNSTNPSLPASPYFGSVDTKRDFDDLAPNVCAKWPPGAMYIDNTPTKEKIDMCGGKPFRECHLPGNMTGICYSMRFQVLSCIIDDDRIALRRYQIQQGVGLLCDPVEEKWLGCGE